MHPYEMYQLATVRRGDRLVKIKPGSLYHTVSRLGKLDLLVATGTDRDGNRPERTTYQITDLGRTVLHRQLCEMLAVPVPEYPRLPLALAEMHNLPAATACQMLRLRIAHLEEAIAQLDATGEATKPRIFTVGVDYVRAVTSAELQWLHALVVDIESGDMPWLTQELIDQLTGCAGSSALIKD